jgi:hypothetical protein
MAFDPNGLIEAISSAISKFPPALLAAALLGGPTAIWFIVRFANPRDPGKPEPVSAQDLLWVCEACRSINADRFDRCYSCNRLRAADLIPVVSDTWGDDPAYDWGEEEPDGWEEEPEEWEDDALEVGIPVGPGLPAGLPAAASWLGAELAQGPTRTDREQPEHELEPETETELELTAEAEAELELEPELDVAVGSDETRRSFDPVVLEPRQRVSARASRAEPRSGPRSEPRPVQSSEPRSLPRAVPRSEPRPVTRSEPRSEPRSAPRSEPRSLPKSEPRSEPRPGPRSESHPGPRAGPRSGSRSAARPAPRGRWTDLPPPDPPEADPPQDDDEEFPKRSARRRKSAGG